ncbi:mechanosensitive ion channel family protein [Limibacter armeniacum]|uniref:mechanosensitive ion channel family protein n=1 Tax=Limibacter armeniacum TaxID=466084 RepID=UPI002FE5B3E8
MKELFEFIYNWFHSLTGISPNVQHRIVLTLLIILFFFILDKITLKIVFKRNEDPALRYKWRKGVFYLSYFLGFLLVARVWLYQLPSLVTYFGLLSAGVAIALRDPLTSFVAWIFILWRKPFDVGDRIEIDKVKGDVIDVRIFQLTLIEVGNWVDADQSTGRLIHVPNHKVFTGYVANYTVAFPYIWEEKEVLITFESDWKKAKEILREVADKHTSIYQDDARKYVKEASKKFLVYFNKLTPIVYTDVKESGVRLTVRYFCPARRRRGISTDIWEDILDNFQKEKGINLAYPTQRWVR